MDTPKPPLQWFNDKMLERGNVRIQISYAITPKGPVFSAATSAVYNGKAIQFVRERDLEDSSELQLEAKKYITKRRHAWPDQHGASNT